MQVWATDLAGHESNESDPGSVLIDTQAPSDPGEPTVTEANEADIVSTGDITVTWTASSDDGGSGLANPAYTFEYSQDDNFDDSDIITTNTPSVELELTEGRWYFQVWATDLAGNTSGQTPGEVLVDLTPPSAPGAPSGPAAVVGDTQVLITWDPSTDDISEVDFYTIEYSQNSDFTGSTTADTADDTNSIELTLADGTWYMQVWATDLAGHESNESDPGEVTVDTQAPIISELQVAFEEDDPEEGTQQATVSWETDKPTTATIEYGFTTEYGTQDESLILDTEHSFDLPGLLACTTYLYEISVTDAVDNSATLDSLEFTTPGCVGSAEPISQISQEIAPGGGEIEFTGEEDSVLLTLDIPADFSEESDDVVFQIKQLDAQEVDDETATPTGLSWIGSYAYDLKALAGTDTNITEFDQPISITLYFEATDVSGIDLTTVQIFRWDTSGDDGEWLELDSCGEVTVDPENPDRYSITCETSNFSVFGLFGEEIPEPTPSPTPTPQPSSSSSGSSSGTSAPTVPFCSDTKPSGTPDLFQIDVTNTQATLYFSPATGSVNKYFVAYGYESEQELFGVEFDQGESGGVLSYTVSHLTPNTT